MSEGQDQDKTEEATSYKLRKAREKGQVARGMDLGFVGSLLALAMVGLMFGEAFVFRLAQLMRHALGAGVTAGTDVRNATHLAGDLAVVAFQPLVALGVVLMIVLVLLELMQLRGLFIATHALKPDFTRLNPAKGLKRLFSLRMVKETAKNLVKFAAYASAAWWTIEWALDTYGPRLADARQLAVAMVATSARLVAAFIAIAVFFMGIDQIIVRGEFAKQMRMSKREVTRESKDREGEPRFRQKRRDLHAQLREQTEGLGKVAGSDLVVVNPEHFAVALRYDAADMDAPTVRAMGRNHFAQLIKRKARLLGIPIVADPRLARGLFRTGAAGRAIGPEHYHAVAALYRTLSAARDAAAPGQHTRQPSNPQVLIR